MRIYARFESGTLAKLRALSPSCPVESASGISDLGTFAPGESVAWLQGVAAQDSRVAGDAMAVIAVHRGEAALGFLLDAAAGGGVDDLRRDAIFWLGQVRIGEASADIQHLMFNDDLPHIRQHAAFSLAQSRFPERATALIRQGRDDGDAEVRSQAWFWLAQTGAKESERAISGAIVADPDREVRNKAVFALSQLPGERGVDALFAVLDDRRMEREVREQALFWLVQSESDRAFAYVDRLLTEAPL
jgi:HEAT repeat protein